LIKAVTFDFWDTLYKGSANDPRVFEKRVNDILKVLQEVNFQFKKDDIVAAINYGWQKAYSFQRLYGKEITPRGHIKYIIEHLGIKVNPNVLDRLLIAYTETLLHIHPTINDKVKETLAALSGKYKLAVICNAGATPGSVLRKIMSDDRIIEYFDVLVFSNEVGMAKPNKKIFALTLQRLATECSAAIHVGDDTITDILGAKLAGMKTVWIASGKEWKIPEADYLINCLDELINILEKCGD